MKNIIYMTIAVASLLCGCKSPEQTAYKTLGSIALTVNTAKHVYEDYRDNNVGKITVVQDAKVKTAYLQYQATFKVAQDLEISIKSSADTSMFKLAFDGALASAGNFTKLIATLVPSFKSTL